MVSVTCGRSQIKNMKQGIPEIKQAACRVLLFCPAFDWLPLSPAYPRCTDMCSAMVVHLSCPVSLCGDVISKRRVFVLLCSDNIKHCSYPLQWVGKLFSSAPSPWFNTVVTVLAARQGRRGMAVQSKAFLWRGQYAIDGSPANLSLGIPKCSSSFSKP